VPLNTAIASQGLVVFTKYIPGKVWLLLGRASYTSSQGWRRNNRSTVQATIAQLRSRDPDAFTNPEKIEGYRASGLHLDLPTEYSIALKNIQDNIATNEERKYIEKANKTREYFNTMIKEFGNKFTFESIPGRDKIKFDIKVLKHLFKNQKEKKFLGIF